MNTIDKFREWYIAQINPRTNAHYKESSVNCYITAIRGLVEDGLVCRGIFNVGADEFMRQIRQVVEMNPVAYANCNHHGNLTNGIKWWKRFLDAQMKC